MAKIEARIRGDQYHFIRGGAGSCYTTAELLVLGAGNLEAGIASVRVALACEPESSRETPALLRPRPLTDVLKGHSRSTH